MILKHKNFFCPILDRCRLSHLVVKRTDDHPHVSGILQPERKENYTVLYQRGQWDLREYERHPGCGEGGKRKGFDGCIL